MGEQNHGDSARRGTGAALTSLPFCCLGSPLIPPAAAAWWGSGPWGTGRGVARRGAGGAAVELYVPLLQLITLSGSAQMVTSSGTKGDIVTAYMAGALAIMVAIHTAGGVSGEAGEGVPAPAIPWLQIPQGPSAPSPSPHSVAGAHLNPAFSFAMCLLEQFPWWKFPIFVAVQILGAFISAGAVYALYYGMGRWAGPWRGNTMACAGVAGLMDRLCLRSADAIWHYSNGTLTASGPRETASIFATYPADYLSLSNGFLDQVGAGVGSPQTPPVVRDPTVLSCRAGPTGDRHSAADHGHPGHAGHPQQGCPQGPRAGGHGPAGVLHRDLHGLQLQLPPEPRAGFWAPALHLRGGLGRGGLQVGRGKGARWGVAGVTPCPPCPISSRGNGWWWVPVVAPLLGATVGSALYQLLVAFHHPEESDPRDEQNSLVLVSAAIPPDTKISPGEKDAGGMLPQKN